MSEFHSLEASQEIVFVYHLACMHLQELSNIANDLGLEYGLEVVNRYETNLANTASMVNTILQLQYIQCLTSELWRAKAWRWLCCSSPPQSAARFTVIYRLLFMSGVALNEYNRDEHGSPIILHKLLPE